MHLTWYVQFAYPFSDGTIADALAALKISADFEYSKPQNDTELAFVHRKIADGDIYWGSQRKARAEDVDDTLRLSGKAPELWHADTGVAEPVAYRIAEGRTTVPQHLEPNDAVFVVFRKAAAATSRTVPKPSQTKLTAVDGPWDVAFQPDRGAPPKITLPALASWHETPTPA